MTFLNYIRASGKLGLAPRSLFVVILLSTATAIAESIGLAMVVPIYDFVSVGGQIADLPNTFYWAKILQFSEFVGVYPELGMLLALAFIAVMFRQVASYSRQIVVARCREHIAKSLRDNLFEKFLHAKLATQEDLKGGELVNIVTNELSRFNSSFAGFVALSNALVMVVIYGIFLAWTSWQLTVLAIAIVLMSMLPLRVVQQKTINAGKIATEANILATNFFVERLGPSRVIRLSRRESVEIAQMRDFTGDQFRTMLGLERLMAFTSVLIEPIILGLVFLLIYFAVNVLVVPLLSLALFLMVVFRLLPVAKDVMKGRQLILSCAGSINVILKMLTLLEEAKEGKGGNVEFAALRQELRFIRTSFRYSNAVRPAVKDVDFNISVGTITAIVGPSGAGKSTLIDLIPALREPTSGEIQVDGIPIQEYSLSTLREGIAYVSQSAQMYDSSIASHVRLGKMDASDDMVRKSLSLAGAIDFVDRLPNGIYERIGIAGGMLSGGQRQRIDLARAIISGASLIVLDEPTSALDVAGESAFIEMLKKLTCLNNITIIVVTHRFSLLRHVDKVVVVVNGQLDAVGSVEEARRSSKWFNDALLGQSEASVIGQS